MKSISTFVSALFFLSACVLGWLIFPVFLIVGGGALLAYAILVEIGVTILGLKPTLPDDFAARKLADRLCRGIGH